MGLFTLARIIPFIRIVFKFQNIFLILFSTNCFAQSPKDSIIKDISKFWNDTKSYFTAPLDFNGTDWLKVGGIVSGTILLSTMDNNFKKISQNSSQHTSLNDKIFKIDNYYGTTTSAIAISGIAYLIGISFDSPKIREAGLLIGESALYSGIVTHLFRRLIGRERPDFTKNAYHFIGPNLSYDRFQALPSGHSTCVFAISTTAAELVEETWLKILFYTPAFLTSYARVYHNRHWFSDVVLGGLIGYFTGKYVTNKDRDLNRISYNFKYMQEAFLFSVSIRI